MYTSTSSWSIRSFLVCAMLNPVRSAIVKDDASIESARAFDPQRHVDPAELGVFGLGVRRCPGAKLAETIVVLGLARYVSQPSLSSTVADSSCSILYSTHLTIPSGGAPPPGNAFAWSGTARGPAAFEAVFEAKDEVVGVLRKERERWADE